MSEATRFGSLESRLNIPHLVSRSGSYFGPKKVNSGTILDLGEVTHSVSDLKDECLKRKDSLNVGEKLCLSFQPSQD